MKMAFLMVRMSTVNTVTVPSLGEEPGETLHLG